MLTNDEKTTLAGMAGYILWSIKMDESFNHIVTTLAHDIGGICRKEMCFLPRSSGYVKEIERILPDWNAENEPDEKQ